MSDLTADPWIATNSEIDAERLHAIGVITFQWNHCELWLFQLFCAVSELPQEKAWTLVYDLGDIAMCTRIGVFTDSSQMHPDAIALIKNALSFYDACRKNRNSVVHAWTQSRGVALEMVRKSKDPGKMEHSPFPCSLADIRGVAEEIQWLSRRLWVLVCLHEDGRMARPIPSPKTLPLPELLWKTPPHPNTKQKRQPQSSRASRRKEALSLAKKA
jgi:hypothetical protein